MAKKRRHSKSKKGGRFEREVCKQLSLWWSKGKDEDLFWRTSGSGARATARGKRGQRTTGHCGDVCSTDPSSKPLMDVVTIELKRGYNKTNFAEVIDRPKHIKQQQFEAWLEQSVKAAEAADSFAWMLIARRDQKEALCFIPEMLENYLTEFGAALPRLPYVRFRARLRFSAGWRTLTVAGFHFDKWLKVVSPDTIVALSREI